MKHVEEATNQIAQTPLRTMRTVVGQHTLDEMLAGTDKINVDIKEIFDLQTADRGVLVTLMELKDVQLRDTMKQAMARHLGAEGRAR